jgi:hypothetical protein
MENMPLDIVSYRLQNQFLIQNKFDQAPDVVRSLGAVQSQDFAGAKWAIGLRSEGLADPDVQRAFDEGAILRTHVLRPTWHFVAPEDIRWMLALTAPRVKALLAYYDRQLELDKGIFKKSTITLIKALQGGNQLTRAEIQSVYEKAGIPASGQRLGNLLMHAELEAVICSGPRKGKQFTYALLEERVPAASAMTGDESLAVLVTKYFSTRGPATLNDFAWWSGLTVADARKGMEMVKSQFLSETIEGQTYWFSEHKPPLPPNTVTAHLLPNYDEFFIGFKDRSAIGKVAEKSGIQKDDAALLAHILILNGQVVGGWKRILEKAQVRVEASLLIKPAPAEQQALKDAAERLGKFLGLSVLLVNKEYSREQRTSRSFY